jgi:toxin FitB
MTGFLVDTNVLLELTRPQSDVHVENWLNHADDEQLFLSVISLGEMSHRGTLGHHGRRSQRKGRDLAMADGLIAATALEHELTVVTRNVRDFADLGISVLNPWPSV